MGKHIGARRLFVGDLHGCRAELQDMLEKFGFRPGKDRLFSVGDIMGKGPDISGTLALLQDLDASVVIGNHDQYLLNAVTKPAKERSKRNEEYLRSLGPQAEKWITYIGGWPYFLEMDDIIMVHAGLEPGKPTLADMSKEILTKIRTWDGKGNDLLRAGDPPWYECMQWEKQIVFGHWAERGLVDLPGFKGLDTGCVYGGMLTGWCPEENRFYQVPARATYAPIHIH